MTTSITAILKQGKRQLNINTGRYTFDGMPPPTLVRPLIASGTSANRYGGGVKVGERATDRRMTFNVRIKGATDREVNRAIADLTAFLTLASVDEANPLYLEYKPNSDVGFTPLWGQDGTLRYEIIHADTPAIWTNYTVTETRAAAARVSCNVEIKPYAKGFTQRLASATGGVLEDTIGWKDGFSRGLIVPEANGTGGNIFTNPVFGHGTWNNAWTDGANIDSVENTDPAFVLFGLSSAKVTSTGSTNTFTQGITPTASVEYTISYYAKLENGGAVSATHTQAYIDSAAQTTTYTAIGDDGWYLCSATVTMDGTPGAAIGCIVKSPYTVYLDGFMCDRVGYVVPFYYGDMLGCAWSGTAHASSSTRTAGRVRVAVADSVNRAEGTVRVVWRADRANTTYSGSLSHPLFEEETGELRGAFTDATDEWQMTDGTNTAGNGASVTFSAGDIVILHFTWDPAAGLIVYKDGASYATNATYTPPTLGTYMYIGTTDSVTNHIGGTFLDFTTYDRAMTAAEVLADHTNITQVVGDNQRLSPIPWLWTKDGDDIVDNCSGSVSGTDRDNYIVCGGIPGSVQADTILNVTNSQNQSGVVLSLCDYFYNLGFHYPEDYLFTDLSGTADVGSSSGDAFQRFASLNTTPTGPTTTAMSQLEYLTVAGKSAHLFVRLADAGSDLVWHVGVRPGVTTPIWTETIPIAGAASEYVFKSAPFLFPGSGTFNIDPDATWGDSFQTAAQFWRTVSGAANVDVDYVQIGTRPVLIIPTVLNDRIVIRNGFAVDVDTNNVYVKNFKTLGDSIDFAPESYNVLVSMLGYEDVSGVTETLTYNSVKVIPRYSLL